MTSSFNGHDHAGEISYFAFLNVTTEARVSFGPMSGKVTGRQRFRI